MLKRLSVVLGVTVAAAAFAANSVTGAVGRGVAVNGDGKLAAFDFEVSRYNVGTTAPKYFGRFNFTTRTSPANEPPLYAGLLIGLLRQLNKQGTAESFGGSGWLTLQSPTGARRFEGTVAVVVNDRRDGVTHVGDPDLITVYFTPLHDGPKFNWSGQVRDGDLKVFERVQQ